MACRICGETKTVRSHIIPKALAFDVRAKEKHLTAGTRRRTGKFVSQSGITRTDILCHAHENMTSLPDKYGVEFVRAVNEQFESLGPDAKRISAPNPDPDMLRRFVLATIWREVAAQNAEGHALSLGSYLEAVEDYLFKCGATLHWPIICQRNRFGVSKQLIDFNLHPYRVRFADRNAWLMSVAGVSFFAISDQRGLPKAYSDFDAGKFDPAPIPVSEGTDIRSIRALAPILSNMTSHDRQRRR